MPNPTDAELLATPLDELMAEAGRVRDRRTGTRITYSPKVFIPLTFLCNDTCDYCTFAQPPARVAEPYLPPDKVRAIARAGARAGCHEALFTLGERPELRYEVARDVAGRSRLHQHGRLPRRHVPDGGGGDRAAAPRQRRGAVVR